MATINNNNGRFQLNGLSLDEIEVIIEALRQYKEFLDTCLDISTRSMNYYVDWSICLIVLMDFKKRLSNHVVMPKSFGKTLALHELFVVFDALDMYSSLTENEYTTNICRQLIFLIHPELPNIEINNLNQ